MSKISPPVICLSSSTCISLTLSTCSSLSSSLCRCLIFCGASERISHTKCRACPTEKGIWLRLRFGLGCRCGTWGGGSCSRGSSRSHWISLTLSFPRNSSNSDSTCVRATIWLGPISHCYWQSITRPSHLSVGLCVWGSTIWCISACNCSGRPRTSLLCISSSRGVSPWLVSNNNCGCSAPSSSLSICLGRVTSTLRLLIGRLICVRLGWLIIIIWSRTSSILTALLVILLISITGSPAWRRLLIVLLVRVLSKYWAQQKCN